MNNIEEIMTGTKFEYKSKSAIEGELNFVIEANIISKRLNRAFGKLQQTAELKGFRKGKVPLQIIQKKYKNDVIRDVFQHAVEDSCKGAVIEKDLPVVGEPRVNKTNWLEWKEGQTMEYTATVELVPDPTVKTIKGLKIEIEDLSITDDEVEKTIKNFLESKSTLSPITKNRDRGIRNGDFAMIDFQGYVNDTAIEQAKADNFMLEMGAGHSMQEFQDGALGMKIDEERDIPVDYPADYENKEIAGKKVIYKVKLHEIKTKEYPELTDEMVKDFEANSVAEFKQNVRKSLEEELEQNQKNTLDDKVVHAFIEANPFEIPQTLINHQLNVILQDVHKMLTRQQFEAALIENYMKKNVEEFKVRAEKEVKLALLLPKLVEKEKIEATDADFQKRMEKIASSSGRELKDVEDFYTKNPEQKDSVRGQIERELAIDFIAEHAKVKKIKPKKK